MEFLEVGSRKCPWCGRTMYSWTKMSTAFECGLCGVRWSEDGMETRRQEKPDYVNEDWVKIDVGWKKVSEGCLVVRDGR